MATEEDLSEAEIVEAPKQGFDPGAEQRLERALPELPAAIRGTGDLRAGHGQRSRGRAVLPDAGGTDGKFELREERFGHDADAEHAQHLGHEPDAQPDDEPPGIPCHTAEFHPFRAVAGGERHAKAAATATVLVTTAQAPTEKVFLLQRVPRPAAQGHEPPDPPAQLVPGH